MTRAAQLVQRIRRGLLVGGLLRWGLVAAATLALLGTQGPGLLGVTPNTWLIVVLAALGAWVGLSFGSTASMRMVHMAPSYAASGRPDLAQQALLTAASRFSLHRAVPMLAVANLALLAHEQGRHADAVTLCRFALDRPGRALRGMINGLRIVLADSELMLGRLTAAYEQLEWLHGQSLGLSERLALLLTRCHYEVAVERWDCLVADLTERAELASHLPPVQSAAALGCLALGCQHTGRAAQRDWLWSLATLLADREVLVARLPRLEALPAEGLDLPWSAPSRPDEAEKSAGSDA